MITLICGVKIGVRSVNVKYFVGDFETTVFDEQDYTEVWASACVELFSDEHPKIFHSIKEQFDYFVSLKTNLIVYYHNLKFDGSFWLPFFIQELELKQAYYSFGANDDNIKWQDTKDMDNGSFKYSISDMGQWYSIVVKIKGHLIEFRDSFKLLPFSVKRIGKAFKTAHQKLDMEYKGFRYAGCVITDEEKKYIANDVLVVKEALEIMFNEGHKRMTIGSCCLAEFKKIYGKQDYEQFFPNLSNVSIDENEHTYNNADSWIRKSYKGGWCYLVKGKENRIFNNGTTADVNSLYPSMMSSESGNIFPVGKPFFWTGDYIPDKALAPNKYFFVRVRTRFYIRDGMLPFIQIKDRYIYKGNEALESSDFYDKRTGQYFAEYKDRDGNIHDTRVEITLTMTDYYLMLKHYELVDFEIIDGCWFYAEKGLFDEYIEKYKKIKMESTGAMRELAKLFLNNLYGKLGSNSNSSFKVAYVKEDGSLGFRIICENDKDVGYIAIASAITSYARRFTITAAQANYHGVNERGFIYADTDSIHCDLEPDEITGITVDDRNFCCWKLESCWDKAIFARQKTYIEHCTHENLEPIAHPFNNIKCAGMPQRCKDLLDLSFQGYDVKEGDDFGEEEIDFLKTHRTYEDFRVGLKVPGKLLPLRIKGGVILVDTYYEMRGQE